MRFNENRPLAWAVLAACALGSVFGLGGSSLARERDRVVDYFYDGAETTATTRSSMDAYLDRAAECAQVMAAEAQLYLGNDCAAATDMLETLDGLDLNIEYGYCFSTGHDTAIDVLKIKGAEAAVEAIQAAGFKVL